MRRSVTAGIILTLALGLAGARAQPFVRAIEFAPDGARLAIAHANTVSILDLRSGALASLVIENRVEVRLVRFSRGGTRVIATTIGNQALVLNAASAGLDRLIELGGMGTDAAFLPGDAEALVGLWDGRLALWDVEAGRRLAETQGHLFGEVRLALSGDGSHAATAGDDQTVRLWQLPALRQVRLYADGRYGIKAARSMMRGVAFGPAATILAAGSIHYCGAEGPALVQFETGSGRLLRSFPSPGGCGAESLAVSGDGLRAAFLDRAHGARPAILFDVAAWRPLRAFALDRDLRATAAALSADGTILATAVLLAQGGDVRIRLWDASRGSRIATLAPAAGGAWRVSLEEER